MELITRIILGAPGFALAIMLHESSHAFAAFKLGDPTGRNLGRVSLDPRRHLDPIGAIFYVATMVLSGGRFAFGWAKPVLINPFNFRDPRRDFMLSSLAGPAANMIQAFAWALLLRGYLGIGRSAPQLLFQPIAFMLLFGIVINVIIGIFNMIPVPPLDGSRLLAWMLPERYAYIIDRIEASGVGMLIIFGLVFFVPQVWRTLSAVVIDPVIQFFLLHVAGAG